MKYWRTKDGRMKIFFFGVIPMILLSAVWEPFLWIALVLTLVNLAGTFTNE